MKLVALIAALLLVVAAGVFQCLPRAQPRSPETLAALAPELGVTFPPSTRLLGVRRLNGMDDWIGVKVEMRRADWPVFLSSTPIDPATLTPGEAGLFGPDQGFWEPNQHSDLRAAQAVLGEVRALNVGVADVGSETVIVYIVNHGS
jgi:hypothetical protein